MTSRLEKGYCLPGQLEMLLTTKSVFAMLQKHPGVVLSTLDSREGLLSIAGHTGVRAVSVGAYNNQFELLVKDLKRFKDRKYRILLLSPSRTRGNHLAENLMDRDLNAFFSEDYDHEIYPGEIMVSVGNLARRAMSSRSHLLSFCRSRTFLAAGHGGKRRKPANMRGNRSPVCRSDDWGLCCS